MNRTLVLKVFAFSLIIFLSGPVITFAKSRAEVNPCHILMRQEIDEIMGEKMNEGKLEEKKVTGMKLCLYEPIDVNSFSMLQITILQGENAKKHFSVIKKGFPDHEVVEGIGDDAFVAIPGLHILTDRYYITIAAGNLTKNKDKALAAGKKVADRLGKGK